jgi:nucleotide-binding universal stress UspA family protein
LTFLHVVKRDLIEGAAGTGEALRLLNEMRALAQADARGVTARGEVRVGEVDAEIVRFAQEMRAAVVVLGYPERVSASEQQVSEEHVWALAEALQARAGAQVVMAR